jgi:hypothetical protein
MALEIPFIGGANSGATFSPTADVLGGFDLSDLSTDVLGEGLGIGIFKAPRKIGTVIPECVIEEHMRDDLEITRHPIETGSAITDHSFKHPTEVVIRAGWSDSGSLPGFSRRAYEALLTLQEKREPFTLMTGKKTYPNMLIASISQVTDVKTEHALMATVVCRQIMIVRAATTTIAPRQQQAAPQATSATTNGGDRQTTPVAAPSNPAPPAGSRTILGNLWDAGGSVLSGGRKLIFGY